jgi:hypothetical protein
VQRLSGVPPDYVEGDHLPTGMNAGIGSPGPQNPNFPSSNTLKCLFKFTLDSATLRLNLKALKVRAAVLNRCPVSRFHRAL